MNQDVVCLREYSIGIYKKKSSLLLDRVSYKCQLGLLVDGSVLSVADFQLRFLSVTERGLLICLSLFSIRPIFASCILKLFSGAYTFRILCLFWPFSHYVLFLFVSDNFPCSEKYFIQCNMATSAFFCSIFAWYVFPHPFSF